MFARVLIVLVFSITTTSLTADTRTEIIANNCFVCHTQSQSSLGNIPPLVGLPEQYISKSLQQFKRNKRQGTIMNRIAKGLNDEEIERLAKYLGAIFKTGDTSR